jgi:hypothetical protein
VLDGRANNRLAVAGQRSKTNDRVGQPKKKKYVSFFLSKRDKQNTHIDAHTTLVLFVFSSSLFRRTGVGTKTQRRGWNLSEDPNKLCRNSPLGCRTHITQLETNSIECLRYFSYSLPSYLQQQQHFKSLLLFNGGDRNSSNFQLYKREGGGYRTCGECTK